MLNLIVGLGNEESSTEVDIAVIQLGASADLINTTLIIIFLKSLVINYVLTSILISFYSECMLIRNSTRAFWSSLTLSVPLNLCRHRSHPSWTPRSRQRQGRPAQGRTPCRCRSSWRSYGCHVALQIPFSSPARLMILVMEKPEPDEASQWQSGGK